MQLHQSSRIEFQICCCALDQHKQGTRPGSVTFIKFCKPFNMCLIYLFTFYWFAYFKVPVNLIYVYHHYCLNQLYYKPSWFLWVVLDDMNGFYTKVYLKYQYEYEIRPWLVSSTQMQFIHIQLRVVFMLCEVVWGFCWVELDRHMILDLAMLL